MEQQPRCVCRGGYSAIIPLLHIRVCYRHSHVFVCFSTQICYRSFYFCTFVCYRRSHIFVCCPTCDRRAKRPSRQHDRSCDGLQTIKAPQFYSLHCSFMWRNRRAKRPSRQHDMPCDGLRTIKAPQFYSLHRSFMWCDRRFKRPSQQHDRQSDGHQAAQHQPTKEQHPTQSI